MKDENKNKKQLIKELAELRQRVTELEKFESEHIQTGNQMEKEFAAITFVLNNMFRGEVDDAQTEKWVLDACLTATNSVYGMIGKINEHGKYDTTTYNSLTLQDCAFPEALTWELSMGMTIRGIWGWPMMHGKPLICNDLQAHPDRIGFPKGHVQLKCFLGVPLKLDGKVVGMVAVANKPDGYTQDDRDTLVRLASIISVSKQHRLALIEQKRTSMELEQLVEERTKALQQSEAQFHSLFKNMLNGVAYHKVIVNENNQPIDLEYVDVNDVFEEHAGLKKESVIGKRVTELISGFRDSEPDLISIYGKVGLTGESTKLDLYFEPFDKWYSISAYCPQKGYVATISEDITERKHAEEVLKKAHDELELRVKERTAELVRVNIRLKELDQLKSMFIASMSHELRTPLNSIIGFTDIILEGMSGKITEEQSKQLTIVKSSAKHLLALINDIIDVSKIESGKVELYIEEFDLSEIVQDVKDSFTFAADKKGLKMHLNIPERLVIKSDERRVKQIVVNLVGNAVKFTDKGKIDIKAEKKDKMVEVSVRDTGIGMRQEDMDKLFDAFSQIPIGGRTEEGTGLGLYLSKKIADLLGGEILAESEFRKGSMFTFTLPLVFTDNHR